MAGSWNLEWLNLNAHRAYPFKEDTSRADLNGFITIPDNLLVDLVIVTVGDVDDTYHISKLVYSGSTLTLIVADGNGVTVTSTTIDLNTHSANDGYSVLGIGDYTDVRGRIVFGDLTELAITLPEGIYEFSATATQLESRTVRPDIRGVRALQVVQADGSISDQISGIIELLAGTNVRLTYIPASGGNPEGIRIDAISGEGLNEECECDKMHIPPPPIRTINGVAGDNNGDITIEAPDACMDIGAIDSGIIIEDTCAKPCCGCVELEFITNNLSLTESSIVTLEGRANLLEQNQINFYHNVLGSML